MRKKKIKKYNHIYFIIFLILYLELMTKVMCLNSKVGFIYTLIYSIPFILLIYILTSILKEKQSVIGQAKLIRIYNQDFNTEKSNDKGKTICDWK